jgi:uncharacterized protein with FMN-binding domain
VKEMKIHLKKVLVSLMIIAGFVSYATYQRFFGAQQAVLGDASPGTVADSNNSGTLTTTTVSQAETVPPAVSAPETVPLTNPPETFAGNGIGDDNEYGDDDEEGGGYVQQQTTQSSAGQTTTGTSASTTTTTAGNTGSTTAGNTTATVTTSAGTTSGGTSTSTATAATASTTGLYKDGQYDGTAANAYYGLVQVRAIVQGGKLTDVQFLSYPNDRNTSIQINTYAIPKLTAEAVKVQSAQVNIVSGATNTSRAFMNSLSSALNQAMV